MFVVIPLQPVGVSAEQRAKKIKRCWRWSCSAQRGPISDGQMQNHLKPKPGITQCIIKEAKMIKKTENVINYVKIVIKMK